MSSTKLLNVENAKTVKGQPLGYLTAVLYLAPYRASGYNVCPLAEVANCWQGCLNTAGRGGMAKGNVTMETPAGELPDNAIQRARIRRTRLYMEDRPAFMRLLRKEIAAFVRKAERSRLIPAVRLNGTSDIQWERSGIMAAFPEVQFYDYTKIAKRLRSKLPDNYALHLSYSQASDRYAAECMALHRAGASMTVVVRSKAAKSALLAAVPNAIDGDAHDLRFIDPAGSLVVLVAKGRARRDTSGFVADYLIIKGAHHDLRM